MPVDDQMPQKEIKSIEINNSQNSNNNNNNRKRKRNK